jgi:hypothetical protein
LRLLFPLSVAADIGEALPALHPMAGEIGGRARLVKEAKLRRRRRGLVRVLYKLGLPAGKSLWRIRIGLTSSFASAGMAAVPESAPGAGDRQTPDVGRERVAQVLAPPFDYSLGDVNDE